jgi:hypothetical protein
MQTSSFTELYSKIHKTVEKYYGCYEKEKIHEA